jgi:hypothetical protein
VIAVEEPILLLTAQVVEIADDPDPGRRPQPRAPDARPVRRRDPTGRSRPPLLVLLAQQITCSTSPGSAALAVIAISPIAPDDGALSTAS